MRSATKLGIAALTFSLAVTAASWGADDTAKPHGADANAPYPAVVSLLDEAPQGWTYRQSPDNFPLYFYDKDTANKSNCYAECMTRWVVLEAGPTSKALGEWTVVKRRDGKNQWAYRTHPVYMLAQDSVQSPNGDGLDGLWHLMPHFQ